jgi:hypothetical protein
MSEENVLLKYPLEVQEEIENQRGAGQNALMICKIIESKFGTLLIESGSRAPTYQEIKKYLKWAKENRGRVASKKGDIAGVEGDLLEEAEYAAATTECMAVVTPENTELSTLIDLTSPKSTLADVKRRLQLSINRLEKLRIYLGDNNYNDKLETTLKGYYVELAKLTHTEVKMAEELRDTDTVDVATINFTLNKLFQCVHLTINEIQPDKRDIFFTRLQSIIKDTRNTVLNEVLAGETDVK